MNQKAAKLINKFAKAFFLNKNAIAKTYNMANPTAKAKLKDKMRFALAERERLVQEQLQKSLVKDDVKA